jgi:4-amino-4-deoxy-L-arabinose transferase-like glycosyltransferase
LLAVVLVSFGPRLVQFAHWSAAAIASPAGIDYGEGIVWEQLLNIMGGSGYGAIEGIPAIVYHYPPVYYAATWLASGLVGDMLEAGRIVSLVSSIATAAVIALTTRRIIGAASSPAFAWAGAVLAGAAFLHFNMVIFWSPIMRVDPLGVLMTAAGFYCGIKARERPSCIYLSALFFVLAVYTKQTSVTAPIAVYGTLLLIDRKLAFKGIAASIAFGLAILGFMMAITEGRFLDHIVGYNVNRFTYEGLYHNLRSAYHDLDWATLLVALAAFAAIGSRLASRFKAILAGDQKLVMLSMLWIFVLLRTLSLVALGKTGASLNYLLEWLVPIAVLFGLACFWWAETFTGLWRAERPTLVAGITALLAIVAVGQWLREDGFLPDIARKESEERTLIGIARACSGWVIGDEMVAILRAGKRVVWEPSIFAELGSLGRYDERAVVDAIRTGKVCAVIVENDPGLIASRYTDAVSAALRVRRSRNVGTWIVYY